MKAVTIAGISLIIIGIILLILPKEEMARGFIAIFFASPLIILGILLLFSIVGASLFFIGFILIIFLIKQPPVNLSWLIWVVYGLYVIGILYGLVEGIIKLIKFLKKKK